MKIEKLTEGDLTKKHKCDSVGEGACERAESLVVSKIVQGVRDKNRVNVYVGGEFFCSLDVSQVVELGLKVGQVLSAEEGERLRRASDFGKLYVRALEYVMMRPRSEKEVRDYLRRKTLDRRVRVRDGRTGEYGVGVRRGFDESLVAPVMERLVGRGYVDDLKFARAWVEGRKVIGGISRRKLVLELRQKGVGGEVIEGVLGESGRSDVEEIRKVILKKRGIYDDEKLKQYLVRQGFKYDDVLESLGVGNLD